MTKNTEGAWFKSSRSNGSGSCVEVRMTPNGVDVRDTKDREGPQLHFTPAEWDAFIGGAKDGDFDFLTA